MNMQDEYLKFRKTSEKLICRTPVFDVKVQHEIAHTGFEGDYISVSAPHWLVVIPAIDGKFVMVRQWRHALEQITVEFPGGVGEAGEEPEIAAARELEEETGYHADKITHLGTVSPNPALFSNRLHIYLAEELTQTGVLNPDEDEILEVMELPIEEVLNNFGSLEYTHAFTGTAIALYLKHLRNRDAV